MADVSKLKAVLEAYGIGVRAGVITPCKEDEAAFRKRLGLGAMPESVTSYWAGAGRVRMPVTLQAPRELVDPESLPENQDAND